MYIGILVELA